METFFEERGKPLRFRSAANGFAQLCSRRLLSPFSRKPPFYVDGSFPAEKDHAWVAAPAQWADLQRTDGSARAGTWPGLSPASPPCQPCLPALPGPECQALEGCPVLSDVLCWQSVPCSGEGGNRRGRVQVCCISPCLGSVDSHLEQRLCAPH